MSFPLSEGTSTFLVKDKNITSIWKSDMLKWLIEHKVKKVTRKGYYENINWMYININSKTYEPGMPGIKITEPIGQHAITFEEFLTIYKIYEKYQGLLPLSMETDKMLFSGEKSEMKDYKNKKYPDIVYKQLPSEELPERLDSFIKRWENIAIEYKRNFIPPEWHIKCASIRFVIYGGYYVIYPANLKVSSELFEYMSKEIESDLWDMGAEYVTYTGMID